MIQSAMQMEKVFFENIYDLVNIRFSASEIKHLTFTLGLKKPSFLWLYASMRQAICYDTRRRVSAKHALAQRMLWTSLSTIDMKVKDPFTICIPTS